METMGTLSLGGPDGSLVINSVGTTVTGSFVASGSTAFSFERISFSDSTVSLDSTKYISKLLPSATGLTINLPDGTSDGQIKMVSLNNTTPVTLTGNFLCPSGNSSSITLPVIASSIQVNWDTVLTRWVIVPSGGYVN